MAGLSELLDLEYPPARKNLFMTSPVPALILAVFCLGLFVYYYADTNIVEQSSSEVVYEKTSPLLYKTAIGGNEIIHLTDGSVVQLNTATRIEVDMTDTQRTINLQSGEAYFEVAHNDSLPFVVIVGETRVLAVGTAFSVQRDAKKVEVTVTEGIVQLKQNKVVVDEMTYFQSKPIYLRAGQVAQLNEPGQEIITEISPEEIAHKLLWQQKMLAFNGHTLQQVVDEFSRYTTLRMNITDTDTATIRVGGYFRSDDIAGLLTSLQDNFDISVEQTTAKSVELRKKIRE